MGSASEKKRLAWIINLSLMLVALVMSLLIGELFIRTFYPQKLYYSISQWDPYVGFTLIPNIDVFSKHEDYTMHIKVNSKGLRDREFPHQKPRDTVRIGMFGDSFTFGEGVQIDEAYPKVLEALLNRNEAIAKTGRRVEVLNFGLGKTGTSHQLAWYQKEGRKYQLDFAIVGFLAANDFTDNWSGVFYLEDGRLVHNPAAYSSIRRMQKIVHGIPFYKWLAAHSHLVNLARQTVTTVDDKMRMEASAKRISEGSEDKKEINAKIYNLTLRLIEEFQKTVLEDGSRFMIVNLPAKGHKLLSDYSERDQVKPYVYRGDALIKDLAKTDIQTLDLVPVFAGLPISKYYFEHDGHMTGYGHQVVASNIYKSVLPEVIQLLGQATADSKAQGNSTKLNSKNQIPSK
jgi:hypothetical protein